MRFKRLQRTQRKSRKKFSGRNKHHLIPRSRGGDNYHKNLLLIDIHKHELWHKLWGNRTIEEILELLTRVARAKRNQREDWSKAA